MLTEVSRQTPLFPLPLRLSPTPPPSLLSPDIFFLCLGCPNLPKLTDSPPCPLPTYFFLCLGCTKPSQTEIHPLPPLPPPDIFFFVWGALNLPKLKFSPKHGHSVREILARQENIWNNSIYWTHASPVVLLVWKFNGSAKPNHWYYWGADNFLSAPQLWCG